MPSVFWGPLMAVAVQPEVPWYLSCECKDQVTAAGPYIQGVLPTVRSLPLGHRAVALSGHPPPQSFILTADDTGRFIDMPLHLAGEAPRRGAQ